MKILTIAKKVHAGPGARTLMRGLTSEVIIRGLSTLSVITIDDWHIFFAHLFLKDIPAPVGAYIRFD